MAAAVGLLPFAFAADPDSGPAAAGRRLAGGHSAYLLPANLLPAKGPVLRPFPWSGEDLELCVDDQAAARSGVRRARCAVPPGGLGPVTGPILTPTLPPAPATPAPEPPGAPANTNEPGKVVSPPAADPGFRYHPPGLLAARDASAQRGRSDDRKVYAPHIVFPIRLEASRFATMNSQIWGYGGGGYNGVGEAGGTECDPRNYDPMQQRDNFCEVRGWNMPLCPSGEGHQGQDIRPPSCKDNVWDVVAVVDGIITLVTPNTTVKLKGNDGTVYEYLHMHPNSIRVTEGSKVKQGDVVGRVSKYMSGTRSTTYHLHFNVRQRIQVGNKVLEVYVPPYASLIAAYRRSKGLDAGVDAAGNLAADPVLEIGAVAQAPPPAPSPPPTTPAEPAPAPSPAPTPSEPPAPPAPAPSPAQPPAPTEPAPVPSPPPAAPAPPAPAPTPAPSAPAPPAPAPAEQPKTWWQRGAEKAIELWNHWWK
jgi:murein DD-endopeptidase MepM/ murein hydrolase activator NlpD